VDEVSDVDVAVVGAGLAGLSSAHQLSAAGCRVVVLEARDRVGGRTWSRPLGGDAFLDLGGQWIGPTQDRIAALAAELGIETFPTYSDGVARYRIGGSPTVDLPEADDALAELDRMAAQIPIDAPWMAEHAEEWDAQTLHSWLQPRVTDPAALALLRLIAVAVFTSEPAELSLLHVLVYIRSAGSLSMLTQAAQERRFVGGAQSVSLGLADALGADAVRLGQPVRRLSQTTDGVRVLTDTMAVAARRAVVAVPITLADRIAYDPPLPAFRAQLHQRLAPGTTFKVHGIYDRPFWRDQGLNGRALTDAGFVMATFDNSPPSGEPGILVGFVEADGSRRFARLGPDGRRKAVLDGFVELFGPEAATPRDYVEMSWSDEEWTRGCYGANLAPGAWTRYGEALRESFGRIHWAGAETSTVWMNYMEGAVRSGERAAAEVLDALCEPDAGHPS
jgi:monoamine oxidase